MRQLAYALACYALALLVGAACVASPLLLALASPVWPAAAATTAATDDADTDADDIAESVTPERMTLKAYPVLSGGADTWDIDAGATKSINTNGGQLRILATVVWSDGKRINESQLAWSERGGFSEGFTYTVTSGKDVVSVSPTGLVTAIGNGEGTVELVPKNDEYAGVTASITFTVTNQGAGLMAKKLQIVNADNEPYGDEPIKLTSANNIVKCYVRVTFVDKADKSRKTVLSNAPNAPESETQLPSNSGYKSLAAVFATVDWQAGDSQYASVTNHKGVATVKAIASATTRLYATITGGDASVSKGFGLGVVYGTVKLSIRNGETIEGEDPSDTLRVRVCYEQDLESYLADKTYTQAEFEALGAEYLTYTLTQSGGKYVTDRAYGVRLTKILKDLKVDSSDISYFTLAANDGANPGKLSRKFLFQKRYYLPNYDIGGSWQEKEQVAPMIALKDSWNQDTQVTGELNSGTRFRLLFGSATSADGSTDKSIKYINTITIVLNGAAPATHGDDDNSNGGGGHGNGGGSGSSSGEGSGNGQAPNTIGGGDDDASVQNATNGTGAAGGGDSGPQWRIFEMVNKQLSDLAAQYEDNPLLPYAVPILGLIVIISSTIEYARFRRKLR